MPSGLLVVYINIRACISFSTILLKLILLHYLVATIEMLLTLFMPFFPCNGERNLASCCRKIYEMICLYSCMLRFCFSVGVSFQIRSVTFFCWDSIKEVYFGIIKYLNL